MPTCPPGGRTALAAIETLADSGLPADRFIAEACRRIARVVPSDGYFMAATDPHTNLCIGAGIVHDLPADMCRPTWDYEFLVPDYLKFSDIAASGRPVADLHEATGGRPDRSARWREYGAATGFRAEVRTAFTLGGAMWGIGQFDRLGDAPRFTDDEKDWLALVAPVLARGLRAAMRLQPAGTAADRGPGALLIDEAGRVVSATREAIGWLDEVEGHRAPHPHDGPSLPLGVHAFASKVQAATRDGAAGPSPRARLRTRTGVWLLMHGSALLDSDQLALIIEPAKAADVAPLIVEAYALTPRELAVTRMIARGLGTSQIAAELVLSPHTVRDHVKAVFEKVGVSSRGELVARMFADHYAPPPHAPEPAAG